MTARLLVRSGTAVSERRPSELSELRDEQCWLDISDPKDQDFALVAEELGLHPLAVEDAQQPGERPKIDEFTDHYFVVFYAIDKEDSDVVHLHKLSIFFLRNTLVTVHDGDDCAPRRTVERRWLEGRIPSVGLLLHGLLDHAVDEYFDVVDGFGERVDALERLIVQDRSGRGLQGSLSELFSLKRDLLRLRRVVAPERDVLTVLSRGDLGFLPPEERVYFRDVYDHVLRVTDEIDTFRDLVSSVVDAALAAISNRLNEVMKVLTSLATILLVMTVMTGFFGQNFTTIIPYESVALFWGSIAFTLVSALLLAVYFRRKGWL
ncbi:MAG: magnesium transporter CorA family protein [Chloroflexota bacterium]|nr:magnesium transporter CorA family protein [Chloroflexota bacterium]